MSNYKTIPGGIIRHQMAFSDANPGRSPVLLGGDAEIEKLREFGDFDRVAKTIGNCPDHGARGSEPLLERAALVKSWMSMLATVKFTRNYRQNEVLQE